MSIGGLGYLEGMTVSGVMLVAIIPAIVGSEIYVRVTEQRARLTQRPLVGFRRVAREVCEWVVWLTMAVGAGCWVFFLLVDYGVIHT